MITSRVARDSLIFVSLMVLYGLLLPSSAIAGNVYILECASCQTVDDFKVLAGSTAAQRMMGGVYVIVGVNSPLTGHIRVTGQQATACTPDGECRAYYKIASITSITAAGATANTLADLYQNDTDLFGTSRVEKVPPVKIPKERASSIIGSSDEEVSPGVGEGLLAISISPGNIPVNTVIKVTFDDGTSATFIKISNGSIQWAWTGQAWDKDGNPIDRSGRPRTNSNSSGASGGSVGLNLPDRVGGRIIYSMTTSSKCLIKVSVTWNGRTGSWYGWTNCN